VRAIVVALVLVVTFAAPALADDRAKAAAHYKQGKAFLAAKQYDQAIAEYQEAYALDHLAIHLFNIGGAYNLKGDLKNAIEFYQRLLDEDPKNKLAGEARKLIDEAAQQLVVEDAKRRATEEAARIAAEQEKARLEQEKQRAEQETKQAAVTAHLKQAEAYAQAGAWTKAGEEHRLAFTVDGESQHLLDAAEAFKNQPDPAKSRDALLTYLEKVPGGDKSDEIRKQVATITRQIEKAEDDERQRKLRESLAKPDPGPGGPLVDGKPRYRSHRGWIVVGGALLVSGVAADFSPNARDGKLEGSDFVPPVLYLLGTAAVLRGVF
jgi:tetratricopeptide (TPR) repeat protein